MIRLLGEEEFADWESEALLDLAFGGGRRALSAYRLREGVDPVQDIAVAARDDRDGLVGVIRFWPIIVGERDSEGLLLGPIAVHPVRQGEGIGATLMLEGLSRARDRGWRFVLLVGDLGYYTRFGFKRYTDITFPPPTDPNRVLGYEIQAGALEGITGPVRKWKPQSSHRPNVPTSRGSAILRKGSSA